MKTKFKRFSHSALAFVLTACMLFSCLSVGTVEAANASSDGWRVWIRKSDKTYGTMIATKVYNSTFDITVNSDDLINGNLEIYLQDEYGNPYGNNVTLTHGGTIFVSKNTNGESYDWEKGIILDEASKYSTITLTVSEWIDSGSGGVNVTWKVTNHTVAAKVVDGQTGYGYASVTQNDTAVSTVTSGTEVKFTATPADNYSFVGWYSDAAGNTLVSEANPYSTAINTDTPLYAMFEKTKNEYYKVNFAAGPNGKVTAKANGEEITNGTTVKWGTSVVLTAAPNKDYRFTKWTGTNESTAETISMVVKSAVNVKAWFAADQDGEEAESKPYFRWGTDSNISNWANIKHKNGRAYGYIDDPKVGTTYYFTVANGTSGTDVWSYHTDDNKWDKNSFKTDFDQFVDVDMYESSSDRDRKLGTATLKTVENITYSRIIIDLGEWKDDGFHLEYNTFRVIPVYDTDETNIDVYAKDSAYRGNDNYD